MLFAFLHDKKNNKKNNKFFNKEYNKRVKRDNSRKRMQHYIFNLKLKNKNYN